ncbi:ABC transporter permease, partial [Geminicoccus flavidas]|uniref:ABC transporter permease n=1 Tax=Geminicoccus flavidas TaxID=2506407 RepID=UPI0013571DED
MATEIASARAQLSPEARFLLLALPGALFVVTFLILPMLSILVFSFWRTESYNLIPDWNLDNYVVLFTTPTYMTFLLRSVLTAVAVSVVALIYSWPIAYFMAKYGGRYRLLLSLAVAAPFFTGVILRITGIQGIMGPVGLINMGLMNFGLPPISFLMYTPTAAAIGIAYLFIPFMVTAIYLSLLNFDFELLEVAKINGAKSWRAFFEVTLPLNWIGTIIGLVLVFVPALGDSITARFLGGPNAASFGQVLSLQFGETGTWALGSAMGVVLFLVSSFVIFLMWRSVNL